MLFLASAWAFYPTVTLKVTAKDFDEDPGLEHYGERSLARISKFYAEELGLPFAVRRVVAMTRTCDG